MIFPIAAESLYHAHMTERIKPYVGVSGVVSPEMQQYIEHEHIKSGLAFRDRLLVLGVKAVHKTQFLDVENKYGTDWYPVGADTFRGALRHEFPSPVAKGVAQVYLDVDHVADADYRETFVRRIVERGQPWLQGLQFDRLPWHDNNDTLSFLEDVKESTGLEVFLQAHGPAMAELGPRGIAPRLGSAAAALDYLLFDASHGTGTRLDVEALRPFIDEAYQDFDTEHLGIAIAGGLNADVVREELPALVEQYPDLSWDAESQLHPENEAGRRPLDPETVAAYLRASADILPEPVTDSRSVERAVFDSEFYWFGGPRSHAPFPHH